MSDGVDYKGHFDFRRDRVEVYGDEGQLHITRGWFGATPVRLVVDTVAEIIEQVGENDPDLPEYLGFVDNPQVRRGWARFVPERHLLDRWGGDGGVLLSRGLLPPFAFKVTFRDGKLTIRRDSDLPWVRATWLWDH